MGKKYLKYTYIHMNILLRYTYIHMYIQHVLYTTVPIATINNTFIFIVFWLVSLG